MVAAGQTLTITNGIQTYAALSNTTVTMTGHCELRVTATNGPLTGCLIHLNSADAWLFLSNVRPSVAATGYLAQVRVNGASAVAGTNVRVDQYAMGTVLIPHATTVTPLQVFSGPNFAGTSAQLGLYTYYTNTALGAMNKNISSFKLKRGYSATLAQNADGTGASKVYIAQDGDLEVGVLPANLDHAAGFVRVFPWRWTSKKGWAGGVQPLVDPLWSYDWDNFVTSTLDAEYVPMRAKVDWNAYANINGKQQSTHALGFNEPDQSNQANMTVAAAIANWPNLLQSGLRLGAPAVSDSGVAGQGLDWLYSFIAQANALNYRVDFVPVHFYKCSWSATQLTNYLYGVYQQTGRPVWVTEFNNGANWCGSTPTYEQNATTIGQYLSALESAPYVERYAIYNWVGSNRMMVADSGTLTPAGVVYHDQQSSLAYIQALPAGGSRGIAQIQFESNTLDSSGFGNNGMAVGIPGYAAGHAGQAVALDGTNSFIQLPPNLANSNSFTFAAWVYWNGGSQWQRIFDFGNGTVQYFFLTPRSSGNTLRVAISTNSYVSEKILETSQLPSGQWTHVAFTLSGATGKLYTNGLLATSAGTFTISPSAFKPAMNFLGKSQFAADPLFAGRLDDVLIADYALTDSQIATLLTNQPPQFTTNFLVRPAATESRAYTNTLAGEATDPDGDTLTYGKASGPAWLTISPNGVLTGTPADDGGTNTFTVRVTDSAGMSAFATLTIYVNAISPQFANFGFEQPLTSTNETAPSGATWDFAGTAGISANNSTLTAGNAPAPEGTQVGFVQGISAIGQTVPGFVSGATYRVKFLASQRQNKSGGQTGAVVRIQIDGVTNIGTFTPSQSVSNYVEYSTNFTASAASHYLRFIGNRSGDNTLFIDNVRLVLVSPPAAPAAPASLTATAGDGQVALIWNVSTGATSYNVKRKTVVSDPYTVIASSVTSTNYTDATAVNGITNYYVVSAVNLGGEGANSAEASALPLSPFQSWQMSYFGCLTCPQADADADFDGDGMSNTNEFLAGTSPTNSASVFRVLSVARTGDDILITWQSTGGRTNVVQVTIGAYTNNFADIPASVTVIAGTGDVVTNYTNVGAATNSLPGFYRIRLVP